MAGILDKLFHIKKQITEAVITEPIDEELVKYREEQGITDVQDMTIIKANVIEDIINKYKSDIYADTLSLTIVSSHDFVEISTETEEKNSLVLPEMLKDCKSLVDMMKMVDKLYKNLTFSLPRCLNITQDEKTELKKAYIALRYELETIEKLEKGILYVKCNDIAGIPENDFNRFSKHKNK